MNGWWRTGAGLLAVLSVGGRRAEPLPPEPLRPFSEIETWLLRGAVIVSAVVGVWLLAVLLRGWLQDRRRNKAGPG